MDEAKIASLPVVSTAHIPYAILQGFRNMSAAVRIDNILHPRFQSTYFAEDPIGCVFLALEYCPEFIVDILHRTFLSPEWQEKNSDCWNEKYFDIYSFVLETIKTMDKKESDNLLHSYEWQKAFGAIPGEFQPERRDDSFYSTDIVWESSFDNREWEEERKLDYPRQDLVSQKRRVISLFDLQKEARDFFPGGENELYVNTAANSQWCEENIRSLQDIFDLVQVFPSRDQEIWNCTCRNSAWRKKHLISWSDFINAIMFLFPDRKAELYVYTVADLKWSEEKINGDQSVLELMRIFPDKKKELAEYTFHNAIWLKNNMTSMAACRRAAKAFPELRGVLLDFLFKSGWLDVKYVKVTDVSFLRGIFVGEEKKLRDYTIGNSQWRTLHLQNADDAKSVLEIFFPKDKGIDSLHAFETWLTHRAAVVALLGIFKYNRQGNRIVNPGKDVVRLIARGVPRRRQNP